jgi:hypothetical protein
MISSSINRSNRALAVRIMRAGRFADSQEGPAAMAATMAGRLS